jgi:putative glutamine amidotransferase
MLKIGVSRCDSRFENYINWLKRADVDIDIKILSYSDRNSDDLVGCDGLLLTGGEDVYPELYGEPPREGDKYNRERDWFEYKLLDIAFERDIPILGICRGIQLTNVYLRGSLIFDIETVIGTNHRKMDDGKDRYHNIFVLEGSKLYEIVRLDRGMVNSSHHQAVDRIGENLRVGAKSEDGVIEALEWDGDDRYLLLIQWHPERIENFESNFSKNILNSFITAVKIKKSIST